MEETVDLREYFGIVKKRFWIVALITIIAVVVSGVISFFMLNPVYEAKSTLIVNTEKNEETSYPVFPEMQTEVPEVEVPEHK